MSATAEWVGFFEVPGILLIRLMSRCNEKCRFCMVAEEIERSDDLAFEECAARIQAQPPGTQIEFFGGEPTIYPRFLDLLRLARDQDFFCSVATNGRIFHSERFTRSVAALGTDQIYIRTSLYADSAELHDYYTATPGSYDQTVRGIRNVAAAGFDCQVNVVILNGNVERLVHLVDLVHDAGVPRIKFGNLISLRTSAPYAVSLAEVRPHLRAAVRRAEELGLRVTVEKTPICVADGRIDLMSTEREIYSTTRVYEDEGECRGCLVRPWCDGLDPEYVELFGTAGISRLSGVPAAAVRRTVDSPGEPELLRMHCLSIPGDTPSDDALRTLDAVLRRTEARHGRLAIFPERFLTPAGAVERQ